VQQDHEHDRVKKGGGGIKTFSETKVESRGKKDSRLLRFHSPERFDGDELSILAGPGCPGPVQARRHKKRENQSKVPELNQRRALPSQQEQASERPTRRGTNCYNTGINIPATAHHIPSNNSGASQRHAAGSPLITVTGSGADSERHLQGRLRFCRIWFSF
jgi:hypothetical protein